eukprot:GHVP01026475.1.p1 GENE.GHVP01026475.1~~GHVP01026475.1.p1  ORF type:complete len:1959 (+),score=357.11 GHVP01026475.1:60-5936(+)
MENENVQTSNIGSPLEAKKASDTDEVEGQSSMKIFQDLMDKQLGEEAFQSNETPSFENLSLEEKLASSDWQARNAGYNEIKDLFDDKALSPNTLKKNLGETSTRFLDDYEQLKLWLSDKNPNAMKSALEAVLLIFENAPESPNIAKAWNDLVKVLIEKVFVSKNVGIGFELILVSAVHSSIGPEFVCKSLSEFLQKFISTKGTISGLKGGAITKQITKTITSFEKLIEGLGPRVIMPKWFLSNIKVFVEATDKELRESVYKTLFQLFLHLRDPDFICGDLPDKQQAEMRKRCLAAPSDIPRPSREIPGFLDSAAEGAKGKNNESDAPNENSKNFLYENLPLTDLMKMLGGLEKWERSLADCQKWSEKKSKIEEITEICKPPKRLDPKDEYGPLIQQLIKILTIENNVAVQVASIKCIGVLCQGLRRQFQPSVKVVLQALLQKMKEKALIPSICECLEVLVEAANIDLWIDEIASTLKSTPLPHVRVHLLRFLRNSVERPSQKESVTKSGQKLLSLSVERLEDSTPDVKTAAMELLTDLLTILPEKSFQLFVSKLDTKTKTILEGKLKKTSKIPPIVTPNRPKRRSGPQKMSLNTKSLSSSTEFREEPSIDATTPEGLCKAIMEIVNSILDTRLSTCFKNLEKRNDAKDRLDAMLTLRLWALEVPSISPNEIKLICHFIHEVITKQSKDTSGVVWRTVLHFMIDCIVTSPNFTEEHASYLISRWRMKIPDVRLSHYFLDFFNAVCCALGVAFTLKETIKNPKLVSLSKILLEWSFLIESVAYSFGPSFVNNSTVFEFVKTLLESKTKILRQNGIKIGGLLFYNFGQQSLRSVDPRQLITKEIKDEAKKFTFEDFNRIFLKESPHKVHLADVVGDCGASLDSATIENIAGLLTRNEFRSVRDLISEYKTPVSGKGLAIHWIVKLQQSLREQKDNLVDLFKVVSETGRLLHGVWRHHLAYAIIPHLISRLKERGLSQEAKTAAYECLDAWLEDLPFEKSCEISVFSSAFSEGILSDARQFVLNILLRRLNNLPHDATITQFGNCFMVLTNLMDSLDTKSANALRKSGDSVLTLIPPFISVPFAKKFQKDLRSSQQIIFQMFFGRLGEVDEDAKSSTSNVSISSRPRQKSFGISNPAPSVPTPKNRRPHVFLNQNRSTDSFQRQYTHTNKPNIFPKETRTSDPRSSARVGRGGKKLPNIHTEPNLRTHLFYDEDVLAKEFDVVSEALLNDMFCRDPVASVEAMQFWVRFVGDPANHQKVHGILDSLFKWISNRVLDPNPIIVEGSLNLLRAVMVHAETHSVVLLPAQVHLLSDVLLERIKDSCPTTESCREITKELLRSLPYIAHPHVIFQHLADFSVNWKLQSLSSSLREAVDCLTFLLEKFGATSYSSTACDISVLQDLSKQVSDQQTKSSISKFLSLYHQIKQKHSSHAIPNRRQSHSPSDSFNSNDSPKSPFGKGKLHRKLELLMGSFEAETGISHALLESHTYGNGNMMKKTSGVSEEEMRLWREKEGRVEFVESDILHWTAVKRIEAARKLPKNTFTLLRIIEDISSRNDIEVAIDELIKMTEEISFLRDLWDGNAGELAHCLADCMNYLFEERIIPGTKTSKEQICPLALKVVNLIHRVVKAKLTMSPAHLKELFVGVLVAMSNHSLWSDVSCAEDLVKSFNEIVGGRLMYLVYPRSAPQILDILVSFLEINTTPESQCGDNGLKYKICVRFLKKLNGKYPVAAHLVPGRPEFQYYLRLLDLAVIFIRRANVNKMEKGYLFSPLLHFLLQNVIHFVAVISPQAIQTYFDHKIYMNQITITEEVMAADPSHIPPLTTLGIQPTQEGEWTITDLQQTSYQQLHDIWVSKNTETPGSFIVPIILGGRGPPFKVADFNIFDSGATLEETDPTLGSGWEQRKNRSGEPSDLVAFEESEKHWMSKLCQLQKNEIPQRPKSAINSFSTILQQVEAMFIISEK